MKHDSGNRGQSRATFVPLPLDSVYGTHSSTDLNDPSDDGNNDGSMNPIFSSNVAHAPRPAIDGIEPKFRASNAISDPPLVVQHSNQLNRGDRIEILDHPTLIDPFHFTLLRRIQDKLELYPERFLHPDPHYETRASLLILSDWPQAQEFASCCAKRKGFKRCNRYAFCPYCCYLRRQKALSIYLQAFSATNWHFVTLSFTGSLSVQDADWSAVNYWEACTKAMRSLVDSKLVRGAYWMEETQVLQFLPLRTIPHLHAIVDADWTNEASQHLLEVVANYRGIHGLPLRLAPNVKAAEIRSQKSLLNQIRYLFKPINIVEPYQNAWPRAEIEDRALAVQLNSELREFVTGYSSMTADRDRIGAKGSLSARSRRFIGVPPNERLNPKELIAFIQQLPDEFYEADPAGE